MPEQLERRPPVVDPADDIQTVESRPSFGHAPEGMDRVRILSREQALVAFAITAVGCVALFLTANLAMRLSALNERLEQLGIQVDQLRAHTSRLRVEIAPATTRPAAPGAPQGDERQAPSDPRPDPRSPQDGPATAPRDPFRPPIVLPREVRAHAPTPRSGVSPRALRHPNPLPGRV